MSMVSGRSRISNTGDGKGNANLLVWGQKPIIWQSFSLNWMKMKNLDQEGARVPIAPLDSQMVLHSMATNESVHLDTLRGPESTFEHQ